MERPSSKKAGPVKQHFNLFGKLPNSKIMLRLKNIVGTGSQKRVIFAAVISNN